jgi:hypothetical protein
MTKYACSDASLVKGRGPNLYSVQFPLVGGRYEACRLNWGHCDRVSFLGLLEAGAPQILTSACLFQKATTFRRDLGEAIELDRQPVPATR